MVAAALVQFLGGQHDLPFRAALQYGVVLRVTLQPLFTHECVSNASIKRVVSYRHCFTLDFWIAKSLAPVADVIDLHSSRGMTFAVPLAVVGSVSIRNSSL